MNATSATVAPAAGCSVWTASAWDMMGLRTSAKAACRMGRAQRIPSRPMMGFARALPILHQTHHGIDCDDAIGAHDQRIDLGLDDAGVAGQLRQCHNGPRQRIEIAGGFAAIARKGPESAHFPDHLAGGGGIYRRQSQAAVAIDL